MSERAAGRGCGGGRTVLAVVAAVAALGVPAAAGGAPVSWAMPVAATVEAFQAENLRRFAEDVRAVSAGEVQVAVQPGAGAGRAVKDRVRKGRSALGAFALADLGDEDAVFAVDAVPFLATNYHKARKLWDASRSEIERRLARQGLRVLLVVPGTPRGIYVRRPLASVGDLRGLKLLAPDARSRHLSRLVGAKPVRAKSADLAAALAPGRVDAALAPADEGVRARAWEKLPYYYHARAWIPKDVVVVNARAFGRLGERTRKAVLGAAAEAERRGWRASEEATSRDLDLLREGGMSIHRPAAALRAELADVGRRMVFAWSDRAGDAGIAIIERFYRLE